MANRYRHHKISPDRFHELLKRGGMKLNDYLFCSGRHIAQVGDFLNANPTGSWTPTMADTMLVELAAHDPKLVDVMIAIANRYALTQEELEQKYGPRDDKRPPDREDKPPGALSTRFWES